jgi:flagellar basal body-associated protein FliL
MPEDKEKKQEERKEPEKQQAEKKKIGNKPIIAGIIGGVIVIEAVMLFFFMQLMKPPNEEEVEEKVKADSLKQTAIQQTSVGAILETPIEVVVNVAGTDGMRFLKVVLVLEYDDQEYKNLGAELERRQAQFKNLLIEQLSAMTLDEVKSPDAQSQIRKEFVRIVNNTLPAKTGQISNVFLNEYIIQ